MTPPDAQKRAAVALIIMQQLTEERYQMMNHADQYPVYERVRLRSRLHQLERELAYAQEERRRALAGAPPAPPAYDPQQPVLLDEEEDRAEQRSQMIAERSTAIRADYQQGQGLSKAELAEKYGLSIQQVRRIVRSESSRGHPKAKLDAAQVRDILRRYRDNKGKRGIVRELSEAFQVQKSTICDIIARRTWRDVEG